MPTQRRKPAGDMTGRKSEELAKEHAEELARREAEIGMINKAEQVQDERGVFDPSSGDMVDGPSLDEAIEQLGGIAYASDDDDILDPTVEQRQPEQVKTAVSLLERPDEVEEVEHQSDRMVVVRVNSTLNDVTVGQGTNFNFIEGRRYKVPYHVAMHLEEKGYLWH